MSKNNITTKTNLTKKDITKFVLPSILLMLFVSIYTLIDSIFISRFVGSKALAALNIVSPLYSVSMACGIMFATGGGAIIAIKLGKNKLNEASKNFTSLLIIGTIFGILVTTICLTFKSQIISALGTNKDIKYFGDIYSFYLIIAFPFLIIKVILESILKIDGSPNTALFMCILGGILNIIFDYIFMVPMNMGIAGAGLGTFLGIVISLFIGFHYFISNKSSLKFKISKTDFKFILKTITNGSSEMVNEFAIGLTIFIFNMLTIKYIGTNGVAAVTIILALYSSIISVFLGFSMGIAPLISYNYGRNNAINIKTILKYSKTFIFISSIVLFIVSIISAETLVGIYTSKTSAVYKIAVEGLKCFSVAFLFSGINIFGSAFFTAFENGKISAIISFTKSFIFFIIAALILPLLFNTKGIWFITPVAEFCSIFIVFLFIIKYQKKYNYAIFKKTHLIDEISQSLVQNDRNENAQ